MRTPHGSWCLSTGRQQKKISVCKTVIKTSYEDDIIDCIENTENFMEISLQILRKFSRMTGFKKTDKNQLPFCTLSINH